MNEITTDFDLNCRACQRLVSSYHCSRYNTSIKRLNPDMFRDVFKQIDKLLGR